MAGLLVGASIFSGSTLSVAQPRPIENPLLAELEWRQIGPYRGGRSCAVTGVYGDPNTFFMGTTGGGIWRTKDEGVTWDCVSDGYLKTGTVGSIAVSESNPKVIYAGMGEHAIRGNITPGDGVYRSDDGGDSWRYLGLKETQFIGKVRVHPKNPDVVWVAALGPVFGKSKDRGVYKSVDGGKSWKKTLYVDDVAGAIDLSIDPNNPNVMFASTWEAWRRPWELVSGGPGSGLYQSVDGGETWKNISKNKGLPGGIWGRIGVSISAVDSNRIYLFIEAEAGGLFSSDDAGKSWELVNDSAGPRQRPWYYSNVFADPVDKDTVYVLNVQYFKSTDGGKTMRASVAGHSDHHDMWIDPADNKRLIIASDGGACVSTTGGGDWTAQDYPTGQFYHVTTDNAFPYNILGAQQDNSTVRIPSRTRGAGITTEDWTSTAGAESGYVVAKPDDPDVVFGGNYGGDLSWLNHRTNMSRQVDPWPDNPIGRAALEAVERFQWTFPIVFSPHDPNTLYVGSQHVLRSRDMGGSWERISPDLTTNDASKQQSSGGPISKDNTAVEVHCTVFTIAESPVQKGVIWSGSDDGLIHVTVNDGLSWQNVTPPTMPKGATVSMIDASAHQAGRAFAAVNNYRQNDFKPYAFVTDDFGKTWRNMNAGLPEDDWTRVVREDPADENVLYCGTEAGVYVSVGRQKWMKMGGIPDAPVHDLVLKENDIVIATHGRGFYVFEDRQILASLMQPINEIKMFPGMGDATRFGPVGSGEVGKNPEGSGLKVIFWSPKEEKDGTITMKDAEGYSVAQVKVSTIKKGFNTAYLFPSYPGMQTFNGLLMWAGYTGSLKAPPGNYDLELTLEGKDQVIKGEGRWMNNPGSSATDAEMTEKFVLSRKVADLATDVNRMVLQCRGYRTAIQENVKGTKTLDDKATFALHLLDSIEDALNQGKAKAGQDLLNYPPRLNNRLAALLGYIQSGDFGPTKQSYSVLESLMPLYTAEKERFDEFVNKIIPDLNSALKAAGKPELAPEFEELRPGRGGVSGGRFEQEFPGQDEDGREAA